MHPAVLSQSRRICVIAAPGSGKTTRILVPKATAILGNEQVDPNDVLLLTFSRISAIDLRSKVRQLARTPRASTVHSFALSFLLSENNHGIRNRINSILLDFQKAVLLADLKVIFPATHMRDLRRQLEEFSAGWATRPHDDVFEEDDERRSFKNSVVNWLAEHEAAMMEEIIYHATDLARQLGNAVTFPRYILVDEYQDLNVLEQELVELIASRGELLLVVGDPDQSIYSFKFAHPDGIVDQGNREDVELHRSPITARCPRRVVEYANQLLRQAQPNREELIRPLDDAAEGEVHFVRKNTQEEEFEHVARSISNRLTTGTSPDEIVVLVPRQKLGQAFEEYVNNNKAHLGIPDVVSIKSIQKSEPTPVECERLILFALIVSPHSVLHARTYIGLPDQAFYSREIQALKQRYAGFQNMMAQARPEDFPTRSRNRTVCERIEHLRQFLLGHREDVPTPVLLDELFPRDNDGTREIRAIFDALLEEDDTPASLYGKYLDYSRSVPQDATTVRVMSLMASKGLGAEHVYIIGCNNGNMPGNNRSAHLTDAEHRQEQLRLLYVGFTRPTRSLTVTWAREIRFSQARGHHTSTVQTRRRSGQQPTAVVGICEFLQALNVHWEG